MSLMLAADGLASKETLSGWTSYVTGGSPDIPLEPLLVGHESEECSHSLHFRDHYTTANWNSILLAINQ